MPASDEIRQPTPDEIRELARTSGKPLEVDCARAFLTYGHDWTAVLGSYYEDGEGPPRELDVLAVRTEQVRYKSVPTTTTCRLRALISCRGFPENAYPLTFSVAQNSPMVLPANLPLAVRLQPGLSASESDVFKLGPIMARAWIKCTGLATRPLVAMDVLEPEKNKSIGREYKLKGDRRLYSAFDSAVKAAMFWVHEDHQSQDPGIGC
jgi:hypothetical protein